MRTCSWCTTTDARRAVWSHLVHYVTFCEGYFSAAWYSARSVAETTKQRLLREAAELLGRQELAKRFNVSESLLDAWIRGDASMPHGGLFTLADILESWANRNKAT
jgi:hypothetical protein